MGMHKYKIIDEHTHVHQKGSKENCQPLIDYKLHR